MSQVFFFFAIHTDLKYVSHFQLRLKALLLSNNAYLTLKCKIQIQCLQISHYIDFSSAKLGRGERSLQVCWEDVVVQRRACNTVTNQSRMRIDLFRRSHHRPLPLKVASRAAPTSIPRLYPSAAASGDLISRTLLHEEDALLAEEVEKDSASQRLL